MESKSSWTTDYGASPPENYQRYFVPAIGAPVARALMEAASLRPGERVLDVACGTGVVTGLAAVQVGTDGVVVGLDVNPGMLAVARKVTPAGSGIDWHEGNAETMPLPDAGFDVVLCQMGLQFMPDRQAALGEMRRVLVPGGRLILNVPGPTPPLFAALEAALTDHLGTPAAEFVRQVFSLHDTTELETGLADAGFRQVAVRADTASSQLPPPAQFLWQHISSTPLAGVISMASDDQRGALERDVVGRWEDFAAADGLQLDVRLVTATARK